MENITLRSCMQCKFILLVEGRVTTPLPDVSPVCDGGQLELNCTITGSILQWRIIPDQNHSQLSTWRYVTTRNQSFQYSDSTITITVISHPMEVYYSGIVINPVYRYLDGADVKCTDLEDQESSSSTVLYHCCECSRYISRL